MAVTSKTLEETLEGLPELDFTDGMTSESIMADLIETYESRMAEYTGTDYELSQIDPMRAILSAYALIGTQIVQLIDRNAKMNFLKYAEDEYLDNLGVLKGVSRRDPEAAICTVRFSVDTPPDHEIEIPAGTEIAGQDDLYFLTDSTVAIPASTRAAASLQFTLATASESDTVIPARTTVTDESGENTFITIDELTIPAGETSGTVQAESEGVGTAYNDLEAGTLTVLPVVIAGVTVTNTQATAGATDSPCYADVACTCEEAGTIGNDMEIGDIDDIIDDLPDVDDVTNISVTHGGTDTEDDEELREDIYIAPWNYSVAGPLLAYKYYALQYSSDIADAYITSPKESPGDVYVYIILQNGEVPDAEMISGLQQYLSAIKLRPLTDRVTVFAADTVAYDIEINYCILYDDEASAETIKADVEDAVELYEMWQYARIGRTIDPSELIASLRDTGAVQITVTSPQITEVAENAVAIPGNVMIHYGGLV